MREDLREVRQKKWKIERGPHVPHFLCQLQASLDFPYVIGKYLKRGVCMCLYFSCIYACMTNFIAHDKNPQQVDYLNVVDELINISERGDSNEIIISSIKNLVPTYNNSQSEDIGESGDATEASLK